MLVMFVLGAVETPEERAVQKRQTRWSSLVICS